MVRRVTVSLVSAVLLLGNVPRAGADAARPGGRANDADAVAYTVVRMPDGGIEFSGSAPHLEFHKTSYRDGHFNFEIASGHDRVTICMNAFALAVTRGGQTVAFATNALATENLAKIRGLLAGSRAIEQYRGLAAVLEARHDQSLEAYGVILGEAVVSWLGGDVGAPARLAQHAGRLNGPAAGRVAANRAGLVFRVRRGDCWSDYEGGLMNAESDMEACFSGAAQQSGWWQWAYAAGCSAEYLVRADGYWFQYLSCSAIPLRVS